ncbi:hypothetical protein [Shewanella pealeana]|uniref:TPR repeat-containing protein n=1 Tax=Shewanella pealeana (strain ATCC 700345 / ANG-SQ1) TaxID=398579 RepID=A8GZ85_SHEPA|nr:hypothetical protein [Shewanella pealeana]ABV85622.1 hypothetical protein Spea_0294 [Shewanella pealeana ATCC 700345]
MSYKFRLLATLLLFTISAGKNTWANALELDLQPFHKGNYLLAKARYTQAATHWNQLSIMLLSNAKKLPQQTMWQSAGLAASLAAIAADKANDPIAYQYWADSTRYLLTGGTNWSQMQQLLHQRLETANTQLSVAMQVSDISSGLDATLDLELSVLQVWDDKLGLFQFSSPKLGLSRHQQAPVTLAPTINPTPLSAESSGLEQGQKKLSGIQTNVSQTPSFTPTPITKTSTVPKTAKTIDSPEANIAAAQQAVVQPKIPADNPMAKGNLATGQNPRVRVRVSAKQKRQIQPVPTTPTEAPVNKSAIPTTEPTPMMQPASKPFSSSISEIDNSLND